MNIKIPKPYIFIGTLLTAGVAVGITYNIILANSTTTVNNSDIQQNETKFSIISEEQYNNLQEQINQLKTNLENTQTELAETKQELSNAKDEVNSLNRQISSLKNTNKTSVINTTNTTTQIIPENKIKQLEDISIKENDPYIKPCRQSTP